MLYAALSQVLSSEEAQQGLATSAAGSVAAAVDCVLRGSHRGAVSLVVRSGRHGLGLYYTEIDYAIYTVLF